MELGKRDFRSWVFFPLRCGRNRRQHISLFWIYMLPSPPSAIHKGKYVCVSVSGPLWALTSSWWVYLTLPRNIWDVSVAISEVKCGNMSRGRGKLDVSSFYELPVGGLTLLICRQRKKLCIPRRRRNTFTICISCMKEYSIIVYPQILHVHAYSISFVVTY